MPKLFTKEQICQYLAMKEVPNRPYFAIRKIQNEVNKYNRYNQHLTLGYGFFPFDHDLRDFPVGTIFIDIENRKYTLKKRYGKEYTGSFPNEERFKDLTEKINNIVGRIEIYEFIAKEECLAKKIDFPIKISEPFEKHIQVFGELPRAYNRHHKVDPLTDQDIELIAQAYRDRYTLLPMSEIKTKQDAIEGIIYVDAKNLKYTLRDENGDVQEGDTSICRHAYYYMMCNVGKPDQNLLIESGIYFYKDGKASNFKILAKQADSTIKELDLDDFVEKNGEIDLALSDENQFEISLKLMSDLSSVDIARTDYNLKLISKLPENNNAEKNIIYLSEIEKACLFRTVDGSVKKTKLPAYIDLSNLDDKIKEHEFKIKVIFFIKASTVYLSQEKRYCFFYDIHGFTHKLKIPNSINLSNLKDKIENKDFKNIFLSFFFKKRYSRIKKLDDSLVSFIESHCNHFVEYPNLNNLDDSGTKNRIIMSAFMNGHIIRRDQLENKYSYTEYSNSNPANSLADFKKILRAFYRFEDKPNWNLVRVIVESDNTAYHFQIEKYHQLINGRLDAYVADSQVVKLTEDVYRLPNRFDVDDKPEKIEKNKNIFLIGLSNIYTVAEDIALFWAKKKEFKLSELCVYKFMLSVERTIWDSLYRGELKLHDKNTREIVEYYDHDVFNTDLVLHWHEVAFVLDKQGIATPEKEDFWECFGLVDNLSNTKKSDGREQVSLSRNDTSRDWKLTARQFAADILIEDYNLAISENKEYDLRKLHADDESDKYKDYLSHKVFILLKEGSHTKRGGKQFPAMRTINSELSISNLISSIENSAKADSATKQKIIAQLKNRLSKTGMRETIASV